MNSVRTVGCEAILFGMDGCVRDLAKGICIESRSLELVGVAAGLEHMELAASRRSSFLSAWISEANG